MKKNENKFTEIYDKNLWKSDESKSGPGSTISKNLKLLSLIESFVLKYNIKSIVDCGCGDFNWMKSYNFKTIEKYIGVDIVKSLINENNNKYSNEKISFKHLSIIEDELPTTDLLICKDVLFHLSYDDALMSIKNFKKSKPKFILSTTFINFNNFDIKSGGWRPINLEGKPFSLGKPNILWENIENRSDDLKSKSIGIWKI